MIFGACDHQVMVARRLVYRETHHRPDVAAQLPDGLQPEFSSTVSQPFPGPKLLRGALPGRDPRSPGAPPGRLFPLGDCEQGHPSSQ